MFEGAMVQIDSILNMPVGTPAMAVVDKEIIPILTEIMKPRKEISGLFIEETNIHPASRGLLDWLIGRQCTVDEINYVLGPLCNYVFKLKKDEYYPISDDERQQPPLLYYQYLFMVATESLTIRCPVLEGPWEQTVWLILQLLKNFEDETRIRYYNSYTLTKWITYVINDADICLNSYLRLELMWLLNYSYSFKKRHNESESKIFESVMHAISFMDIKYLDGINHEEFIYTNIEKIFYVFGLFKGDVSLGYSQRLAIKMQEVENIRLSSLINDVTFQSTKYPNRYNEPHEFNCVSHLIKTITCYLSLKLKESEEADRYFYENSHIDDLKLNAAGSLWMLLIHQFKECLIMPYLLSNTATFVMEGMELFCLTSRGLSDIESGLASSSYLNGMRNADSVLKELCDQQGYNHIVDSPLGQEIWSKYSKRLKSLRFRLLNVLSFPYILGLIYFDQILETGIATPPNIFDMRW